MCKVLNKNENSIRMNAAKNIFTRMNISRVQGFLTKYIFTKVFFGKYIQAPCQQGELHQKTDERKYFYKKVAAWHKNATWVPGKLSEKVKTG